ncbi:PqqD family protein [Sphingobacterium spiritivorum]|uniref:PqqD family protein n=2 Tax=Sphingobacterium spiritivorum TaxID=258 RepID=UPI003DA28D38
MMMRLRTDIRLRKIGEEYIIVDPGQDMVDMSKAYTLNETAAFIWNELQNTEFSVSTIAQLLRDNYDLSPEIADKDAKELVKQLQSEGLLKDL